MKKKLYPMLLGLTAVLLGCIVIFAKEPESSVPLELKERRGAVALSAEWLDTKAAITGLQTTVNANPEDVKSKLSLSQAYIQEARITGDHAYYDKAALDLLEEVLKKEPKNFDALCCKATVLLSQHHFSDALQVAKEAQPLNPSSAFVYGLMCDAYVELGDYKEAVKMADKMVSMRPDIRSYARVSYLREIHGETRGAIEAAKFAVAAGYPGLEQTVWTRTILAHLYESTGNIDTMEYQYRAALAERPDYAFALAGLGRVEKLKGNYKEAISYYEKANGLITEYSFYDELTDLYRLNGEDKKAEQSANKVIEMLSPIASVDEGTEGHGHYADRELAYAYIKKGDYKKALEHAWTEFNRRPANIDVCETAAWASYKAGNTEDAFKLITIALRTNCKNPVLRCRAGLIYIAKGKKVQGTSMIRNALAQNPNLSDTELKNEVKAYL
jgi:tetratricopeptide (TPR) repeat protein